MKRYDESTGEYYCTECGKWFDIGIECNCNDRADRAVMEALGK